MSNKGKFKVRELPVIQQEPADWGHQVMMMLARVHSRLEKQMTETVAAHGMTLAQFDVLATLWQEEGITQQELAGRLLVTKGNVVGLIDRLCTAGFVERRADPCDRRANTLYLTLTGRNNLLQALPCVSGRRQELFKVFTQNELKQMHEFLQRLEETMRQ
jgi:DNA-binding MarR family transcriptional regulator